MDYIKYFAIYVIRYDVPHNAASFNRVCNGEYIENYLSLINFTLSVTNFECP